AFLSLAVLVAAVHEPDRPAGLHSSRAPLSAAELTRLGIGFWLIVTVGVAFTLARFSEAFLILRAQAIGLPAAVVPAVLVVMNIAYALSSWPAGVLSDSIGRFAVLLAGLMLLVGADLILAIGTNLAALSLGVVLWGFHMGLTQGLLASV